MNTNCRAFPTHKSPQSCKIKVTKMSSSAAPVMKPPLGTWAEDVRSQTHVPTLQRSPTDLPWNPTEEHLMDALEARAFWLASQTESGAWLIKEYREWQFNTDLKCFVARCSGQSVPIHSYPYFTCMEVYNLFQSRGKSVPQWILNLTKEQFPEHLKWTLRPSALDSLYSQSQSRVRL
jgi:hypothetical protein